MDWFMAIGWAVGVVLVAAIPAVLVCLFDRPPEGGWPEERW